MSATQIRIGGSSKTTRGNRLTKCEGCHEARRCWFFELVDGDMWLCWDCGDMDQYRDD